MYNINKCQIAGNLTRTIELKELPSGNSVASFSLAINRTWKDKAGAKQEQVEFVNFVAFGKTADTMARYCVKGQNLFVEGRMQTRSYDKDGVKHYRTEVIVNEFQFGQKPKGAEGAPQQTGASQESKPASDGIEYPVEEINPEDIPF